MPALTVPVVGARRLVLGATIAALLSVLATGCSADVDPGSRTVDRGTYSFSIQTDIDDNAPVYDKPVGVLTVWSPDIGTVVLGPEDQGGPQVQLILAIEGERGDGSRRADVVSATMSTTQMRVGTADQLKAKAFTWLKAADCNLLTDVEIGANYIRASFCIAMERIRWDPSDPAERRLVRGTFTAVEP